MVTHKLKHHLVGVESSYMQVNMALILYRIFINNQFGTSDTHDPNTCAVITFGIAGNSCMPTYVVFPLLSFAQ
jgi:hypothetical protein